MAIRDTVLSIPVGRGEGYIEKDVEGDYASLITVNGKKLSALLAEDPDAVKMDYDVYNNMITLYLKKDNAAGFRPDAPCTITLDGSLATFEGVALGDAVSYDFSGRESEKWSQAMEADLNGDGKVNILDVTALLSHLSDSESALAYGRDGDLTGDGIANIKDVSRLLRLLSA